MGTMIDPGRGVRLMQGAASGIAVLALLGAAPSICGTARSHSPRQEATAEPAIRVRPAPIETLDMPNFRAP